jgi:hypothetical protein
MNKLLLTLVLFVGTMGFACNSQTKTPSDTETLSDAKVEVYYFHYSRRCNTCVSVENNAKQAMETLYANELKNGTYLFQSVNLDEESSKALADKLKIGGQTLMVVSGTKSIDITDKAFLNAKNTEKMQELVKNAVSDVLVN